MQAELSGDYSQLLEYEEKIKRAEQFYLKKHECSQSRAFRWFCRGYSPRKDFPSDNVDEMVRLYTKEHFNCGCIDEREFSRFKHSLERQGL